MIGTEQEAAGWWCPMARVAMQTTGENLIAANRYSDGSAAGRCIASECALWRWVEAATRTVADTADPDSGSHEEPRAGRKGHCGLAPLPPGQRS